MQQKQPWWQFYALLCLFFNLIKFWQITLEIVVAKWNSWSGLHTFASHWDFSKLQRLERDWWGEQRGLIHQQNYNRADFFWRSPSEVEKCRIDGNFQTLYVGGAWEHDGTKLLATNKNKHRHLACSETFFFFFLLSFSEQSVDHWWSQGEAAGKWFTIKM